MAAYQVGELVFTRFHGIALVVANVAGDKGRVYIVARCVPGLEFVIQDEGEIQDRVLIPDVLTTLQRWVTHGSPET